MQVDILEFHNSVHFRIPNSKSTFLLRHPVQTRQNTTGQNTNCQNTKYKCNKIQMEQNANRTKCKNTKIPKYKYLVFQ